MENEVERMLTLLLEKVDARAENDKDVCQRLVSHNEEVTGQLVKLNDTLTQTYIEHIKSVAIARDGAMKQLEEFSSIIKEQQSMIKNLQSSLNKKQDIIDKLQLKLADTSARFVDILSAHSNSISIQQS